MWATVPIVRIVRVVGGRSRAERSAYTVDELMDRAVVRVAGVVDQFVADLQDVAFASSTR